MQHQVQASQIDLQTQKAQSQQTIQHGEAEHKAKLEQMKSTSATKASLSGGGTKSQKPSSKK
jgi:hypothetical protein